jgi:hypothetical protein
MAKFLGSLMLCLLLASFAFANEARDFPPGTGPVNNDLTVPVMPGFEDIISWIVGPNMPTARYGAVSGWVAGWVYFAHGGVSNAPPFCTNVCERYNATTGIWQNRAPAPTPRRMVGAGRVQSSAYLHSVGGLDNAGMTVGTYERYHMSTDTWVTLASCTPRWAHGAAALPGNFVYVFGGSDAAVNQSCQMYDPVANAWFDVADLPEPRGWCAGATLNGKVYCIGGAGANTMFEYDPVPGTWEAKAPMPANRSCHWAVADCTANVIKVFGGATSTTPTPDVLVWSPNPSPLGTWTTETPMPGPRLWPCVGGDDTRTFFVMGGFDGSAICNQSWIGEEVDPPSVTVTLVPVSPPIIIPPLGGRFEWIITIHNGELTPQTLDIWTEVTGPSTPAGWGPKFDVVMSPGATISRQFRQRILGEEPPGAYTYTAKIGDHPSVVWDSDSFPFWKAAAGADGWAIGQSTTATPTEYAVRGASPNPFNPITTLSFALPQAGSAKLSVYNVAGREVATLVNGWRDAGNHEITFDATGLASGLYIYQLSAGDFHATGKMMLTK